MKRFLAMAFVAALALAGCSVADQSKGDAAGDESKGTVTVLAHDSFELDEARKAAFEKETGYTLNITAPGDAGMVLNQLILNKENPNVDAVFGIDNMSAQRAIDEGVIADYAPKDDAAPELRVGGLTAVDRGDVCLNADTAWFDEHGVALPASFEDLTKPEYKGLFVLTNPVTSSPGLAFLAGTVEQFGDGWQQYWKDLLANEAKVDDSWSDAFYTDFSAADGKGAYPLVLSYASSPAYGEGAFESIDSTCVNQVEYVGVVKDAPNEAGAKAFVDFMLSDETQATIPETMYMYPVADVELPTEWATYAKPADSPMVLDPATVAKERETWQKQWTEIFEAQ